ncbi:hypothetical protein BDU57DRAFT_524595 [Ampelomyces quisqualis]|uniref:Uncharacterized protein n=1 Tax=Ampelomyces quisqualis TaxID=50730 RepID=A0A6A5Q9J4_AMPQU|nr:hypothetical protein BDU57DRAFT_524595 [Ampelomyces quisqualis]
MSKRSAPSSPIMDNGFKKQKTDSTSDSSPSESITRVSDVAELSSGEFTIASQPVAVNAKNDEGEDGNVGHGILPKDVDSNKGDDVIAQDVDADTVDAEAAKKVVVKKTKAPPVKEVFNLWKPEITLPASNDFWGVKPKTGDARPHANQPAARDSNAAVHPPLWEDRGFRFKRGSRYVKYFGPIKPEGADDGPDLDQEDLLVLKLMDMRPKNKRDQAPRRIPTFYAFEAGKPKDWNNMQAIKALNDRRGQAIDRITVDAPWSQLEREYLAQLLVEHPMASIWELTELHNDHFMGKEFTETTGFAHAQLSLGRTVESVRHEYMSFKPVYDGGEAPENVRFRNDNSVAGKALRASKKTEKAFGAPSHALEKEWDGAREAEDDADDSGDECQKAAANKATAKVPKTRKVPKTAKVLKAPKTRKAPKTAKGTKLSTKKNKEGAAEELPTYREPDSDGELNMQAASGMLWQPMLDSDEEELAWLGGVQHAQDVRNSPPLSLPPDSPRRKHRASSLSSDSSLSDAPPGVLSPSPSPRSSEKRSRSSDNSASPGKRVGVAGPPSPAPSDGSSDMSDYPSNLSDGDEEFRKNMILVEQEAIQAVVDAMPTRAERSCSPSPARLPSPAATATRSPNAARKMSINEDYDDDEDEGDL